MIYFKNAAGEVYSYESLEDRDLFGPSDLVEMTTPEVDAHLNPKPTYQQALALLNSAYQLDVEKFNRAFALAYLSDGPPQESKQAAIRAQYEVRKTQHASDAEALKVEYGIGGGV
jgi:hypothetical protein